MQYTVNYPATIGIWLAMFVTLIAAYLIAEAREGKEEPVRRRTDTGKRTMYKAL